MIADISLRLVFVFNRMIVYEIYENRNAYIGRCFNAVSMILNSGCSEAGNGRKQTTENPGAIFGEVKSAAGAKMLTPIALRGDKKLRDICFLN